MANRSSASTGDDGKLHRGWPIPVGGKHTGGYGLLDRRTSAQPGSVRYGNPQISFPQLNPNRSGRTRTLSSVNHAATRQPRAAAHQPTVQRGPSDVPLIAAARANRKETARSVRSVRECNRPRGAAEVAAPASLSIRQALRPGSAERRWHWSHPNWSAISCPASAWPSL